MLLTTHVLVCNILSMYTLRTHLNDVGLSPESQEAHYRLIEAISNELIECGLIK